MSRDEKIMMGVMMAAIVMWVLGDQLGIAPVVAAMLGLAALLLTGVLKWKECLEYNQVRSVLWCAVCAADPHVVPWPPVHPGRNDCSPLI